MDKIKRKFKEKELNIYSKNKFDILKNTESQSDNESENESQSESESDNKTLINTQESEFNTLEENYDFDDNFEEDNDFNYLNADENFDIIMKDDIMNFLEEQNDIIYLNDDVDFNDNIDLNIEHLFLNEYTNNSLFTKEKEEEKDEEDEEDGWTTVVSKKKIKYKNKNIFENINFDKLKHLPLPDNFPKSEYNSIFRKRVIFTKSYLMNLLFLLSGNCKMNYLNNIKKRIPFENPLNYYIKAQHLENDFNKGIRRWSIDIVNYILYHYRELNSYEFSRIQNQKIFFTKFLLVSGLWKIFNLLEKNFDFIQNHFYTYYLKIYDSNLSERSILTINNPPSLYLIYLSALKKISIPRFDNYYSIISDIDKHNSDLMIQMIKTIFFKLIILNMTNYQILHKKSEKYWPYTCHKIFYFQKNYDYLNSINILCEKTKSWIPYWFEKNEEYKNKCIIDNNIKDYIYEFYFCFIKQLGLYEFINISLKHHGYISKDFLNYCLNNYLNNDSEKTLFLNELNTSDKWKY
jgi:hypothetical protein